MDPSTWYTFDKKWKSDSSYQQIWALRWRNTKKKNMQKKKKKKKQKKKLKKKKNIKKKNI